MLVDDKSKIQPGQRIARGVCRGLWRDGFATLTEFVPTSGLRVDVMAIDPRGEIWIVECKSSRTDFTSDSKWSMYLEWCDAFYWAVDADFPSEILPLETGVIVADDYDAEIVRTPERFKLPGARRRSLTLKFAHAAAGRHIRQTDPGLAL